MRRHNSDPPPVDEATARALIERWTEQEAHPGYSPPGGSWPAQRTSRGDIPGLRAAFASCGGIDHLREGPRTNECNEVAFKLAVAILGGTLYGHLPDEPEEVAAEESAEGTELMRCLADAGSMEGSCGWAFILHSGDLVQEDVKRAAAYHRQAATAGYAQSMHELGTMHYLGDGLPEDSTEAARWYRMAAELGISASMYMLGELLLTGEGITKDVDAAKCWFAAAGELGHRGARSQIVKTIDAATGRGERYYAVASVRVSDWEQIL
jgi:hypothetical protein